MLPVAPPDPATTPPLIPVLLVGGFLGSGKTSLLRSLLPRLGLKGITAHVFVNDYRNAWVDAQTLQPLARDVTAISGDCVCCGSRDELMDALAGASLGPRGIALIEANGTADTVELLEILTADARSRRYMLPRQLTVIDAKRWQKRYWNNALEAMQVRSANYLIATRRDEVDDPRWDSVRGEATRFQPHAAWTDPDALVAAVETWIHEAPSLPPRRFRRLGAALPPSSHDHHRHHFASMEIKLPRPVSKAALESFLVGLPREVLRAKGVAILDGPTPEAWMFQVVDGASRPAWMKIGGTSGVDSVAILIGAGIPQAAVLDAFHHQVLGILAS